MLERIRNMKTDLAKAINLLDLGGTMLPWSFYDFGIMMALYYLYMHIIERIISNNRQYSRRIESHIRRDKWKRFKKETNEDFDLKTAKVLR